jgi:hypothetical protein
MPTPLTVDILKRELRATEKRLAKKIDEATVPHFTALKTDLGTITDRLDAIEKLLWQGQRLDEHENRIIKLAETVGRPDLAIPFSKPISSQR